MHVVILGAGSPFYLLSVFWYFHDYLFLRMLGSSPGGSFLGLESPIWAGLTRKVRTLEDSALTSEAVVRWIWGIRSRFWDS